MTGDSLGLARNYKGFSNVAKAKVVCETCNGGWMKGLEDDANPVMKRMFDERIIIQLPRSEDVTRNALAKWVFKTALMIQYHYAPDVPKEYVVPPKTYQSFFTSQTPPDGCVIFLAHHTAAQLPNGAHSIRWAVQHRSRSVHLEGEMYGVTFFIQNLVMQVVGLEMPFRPNVAFPQTFRAHTRRLWPPGIPVEWPISPSMSDGDLIRFGAELADLRSPDNFGLRLPEG